MDILSAAVPKDMPSDIHEEVLQDLAVDFLSSKKSFAILRQRALQLSRRVRKHYADRWSTVSLTAPLNAEGLTLEDVLEG